ncbi:hypothetical protein V6S02_01205 [Microbacterium sp. CCNWLW134]|uniref:hypothetical protein n=1 Tax=Microbacterium sp. CCNWLW134 TaxID=3122064 RepID=UPI00301033C3
MFTTTPVPAAVRVVHRVLFRKRRADDAAAVAAESLRHSRRVTGTAPSAKWLALG